ncbi:alternative ribosome rescue aminoacyl-tRNA hydrolase ArfB [Flavimarina sp. Hel_I_48]|uniref:alternative ribosome rescue aminoacyl-tRNA hydrolase ArfB n=1 Tax=Flavimarina sp. Hel_I_48 TaxID=1392488 RepID=UPI0004DFB77B|nr:alternative ribosome rescue aminoacyl-tRNA hydrolase ArfB [Flavimarina sp. Hel_I_48]
MKEDALLAECGFKAVRSSGPGGQHVNKTSTKVVLSWDLANTSVFDEDIKLRLSQRLANRLTKNGVLLLHNDQSRSQHTNKEAIQKQFLKLIEKGLQRPKKRKKRRVSKSAKLKRLGNKKHQAEKKANRKPPKL